MTDANGNTSTTYTDGAGRTLAIQHPTVQLASSQQPPVQLASSQLESITYTAHDANGNRIATRSPAGGGNGSSVTLVGEDCTFDALNRETYCADLQEQNDNTGRSRTFNAASQGANGVQGFES